MATDRVVLLAARNAFLFVLLALVGVSTYQFATIGRLEPGVAVIWVVGAGGFYASKWYYRRQGEDEGAAGDEVTEAEDSTEAQDATEGDGVTAAGDRDTDADASAESD